MVNLQLDGHRLFELFLTGFDGKFFGLFLLFFGDHVFDVDLSLWIYPGGNLKRQSVKCYDTGL